ncbi:MAG TPA: hypothetical protein VHW23_36780 [Kofleriaceae bacterium]|jgi:hypothetical protein|nr:hypothetical protein [Kofleriaceae bacterium]
MTASRPPDVDALARRLPRREPPPERSAAVRHALLDAAGAAQARQTRAPVRRWMIGVGVAAAAACVVLALRVIAPAHPDAPRVATAPTVARTAGSPSGSATRIADPSHPPGALAAPAAHPAAGDPLPDGRSAIHATRPLQLARGDTSITAPPGAQFDVDVQGDRVRLVTVRSGWVVVADAHSAATVVVERETWFPTEPPAPPQASPATNPGTASPGSPAVPPPGIARLSSSAPGAAAPRITRPVSGAPSASPPGSTPESRPPTAPPRPAPSIAVSRPPPEPAPAPAPPPPAPEPPAAEPAAINAATQAAAAEQAFHDGLRALFAGNARDATGPLDRACGMPSTSQDDVCYWAAIAWLRVGDRPQARRALTDVLAHYPGSTHAGEASVALGWLLLDAGDRGAARARFAAAVNDRMPSVRTEATRGLAAAQ